MSFIQRTIGHKGVLTPIRHSKNKRELIVDLLSHANQYNPYYKGRYTDFLSQHTAMHDDAFWDAFAQTPITTKQNLKSNNTDFQDTSFDRKFDLIADGVPPGLFSALNHIVVKKDFKISISTGGTSGVPTYRWLDHHDANVMAQSFLESFVANGWNRGENFTVFYPLRSYFTNAYVDFNSTLSTLFGFTMVPFETLSKEKVVELLDVLRQQNSRLLVIFPCVMQRVAEIMKAEGIEPFRGLPYINVSGEFLMDCSKAFIQEMFPDSDLQITYGAVEVGEVAHQYGPSSFDYEVFDTFAHIEEGPDDTLLITSLQQKSFPMIRYQMEDKGLIQTDEDGRQFLTNLEGKNTDFLTGADGEKYYTSFFNHMVNMLNEEYGAPIIHFMLRYDEPDLEMNFVLKNRDNTQIQRSIRNACLSTMSRTFPQFENIYVNFVDHFDHNYTRKFKIIGQGDGMAEVVGGYYKRQAS